MKKAATITTGTAIARGATFITAATDKAPNPTCDKPSPIIENLLSTRLTPRSAQHSATSPPAIMALTIKSYENNSFTVSNIAFSLLHLIQKTLTRIFIHVLIFVFIPINRHFSSTVCLFAVFIIKPKEMPCRLAV